MMAEDRAKRSMMDAAKLAEDLRMEQDNTNRFEAERKMMEGQVKDLQVRTASMIMINLYVHFTVPHVRPVLLYLIVKPKAHPARYTVCISVSYTMFLL